MFSRLCSIIGAVAVVLPASIRLAGAQAVDVASATEPQGAFNWTFHPNTNSGTFSANWSAPAGSPSDFLNVEGQAAPLTGIILSSMTASFDSVISGPGFNIYDLAPAGGGTATLTLFGEPTPVTISMSGAWLQTDPSTNRVQLFLKLDSDPQFHVAGLTHTYNNYNLQIALAPIDTDQTGSGTYSSSIGLTGTPAPEPLSISMILGVAVVVIKRRRHVS